MKNLTLQLKLRQFHQKQVLKIVARCRNSGMSESPPYLQAYMNVIPYTHYASSFSKMQKSASPIECQNHGILGNIMLQIKPKMMSLRVCSNYYLPR